MSISVTTTPKDVLTKVTIAPVGAAFIGWHVAQNTEDKDTTSAEVTGEATTEAAVTTGRPLRIIPVEEVTAEMMTEYAEDDDLYSVLGVREALYRPHALTEEVLKKQFYSYSRAFHPDKMVGNDDTVFKTINRAFEVFADKYAWKMFNGSYQTYDRFPSAKDCATMNAEKFFAAWKPIFYENARWASKRPVPMLGSMQTTKEKVEHFYQYWRSFVSNREYPEAYKHRSEDANSRNDRRWMEKENAGTKRAQHKKELERISRMVQACFQADPRTVSDVAVSNKPLTAAEKKKARLAAIKAKAKAGKKKRK